MYRELSLLDIERNDREIQNIIFTALKYNISGFAVFSHHLNGLKDVIPHGLTLACPIDYPYGISDTSCRNHLILSAIRRGANTIDLVAPLPLIVNRKYKKILADISSNLEVCKDNGVTLRVMLDYRIVANNVTEKVAYKLRDIGVEYILPCTGLFIEDFEDSLLVSKNLQEKTKMSVIFTSNFVQVAQVKSIEAIHIFGIRLRNLNAAQIFMLSNGV